MKKFAKYIMTLAVFMMPFALTSCYEGWDDPHYTHKYWYDNYRDGWYNWSDDNYDNGFDTKGNNEDDLIQQAEMLSGTWEGTMEFYNAEEGTTSKFNAQLTFSHDYSKSIKGVGTEYDYLTDESGKIIDEQNLKFKWYISEDKKYGGNIYIKYNANSGSEGGTYVMDAHASEKGFYLDKDSFEGYMYGTNASSANYIYINMRRVTSENSAKAATRANLTINSFGSRAVKKVILGKNVKTLPNR